MSKFTTNTYTMKREIVNFSNKISNLSSRPNQKFSADMIYGMLASNSCLLTDIADKLHEPIKKVNTVERLSKNLLKPVPDTVSDNYFNIIKKWVPEEPVIHLDDSDIVKPNGYKFEDLCRVRDGSESSSTKNIYKNGYHVTEACVLTKNHHPVSIFSKIYSSKEKNFKSTNAITF